MVMVTAERSVFDYHSHTGVVDLKHSTSLELGSTYTSHMCDISLPPSYTPDGMDQQIITGTVSSESHRQWWEGGGGQRHLPNGGLR